MIDMNNREVRLSNGHTVDPEAFKWHSFRKKPVIIQAAQLEFPVIVVTLEGEMKGNKGDWLIIGVNGEIYPCRDDIFMKTYEKP